MRMLFKSIIMLFFFFSVSLSIEAKEKSGRLSIGGGIHNYMENGIKRCEEMRGGCDPSSSGGALVNYKDSSIAYSVEYISEKKIFRLLKPYIGFNGTDKEAYYGYFGFGADLFFGLCKCFIITPTLAVGWYIDGNEIKMGNRVQFRSGGDIYYRFKNNTRIGVGLYHISNAGLGDQNPGAEQAILKYQIPF